MRFVAGQLTWLSVGLEAATAAVSAVAAESTALLPKQEGDPPTNTPASSAPALPGDLRLAQLLVDLAKQHAVVSLPAAPRAAATAGTSAGAAQAPGVWVRGGAALQAVMSAVLSHLAQHLPW